MKPGLCARLACSLVLTALASTPVQAATLVVAPGQSLGKALAQAVDGDTIALQAGEHRGQVAVITHRRLTLRGINGTGGAGGAGGRPVLHAGGQSAEGKAILVVRGGDIRIENIEFRGARVADRNGAGIRFEKGRLLVKHCAFFDNENGLLTANFGDAELTVEDSEFAQAPAHTPLPHLIYVGRIARFTLTGSRVRGGQDGHLVKTRAAENHIRYNQLVDGAGGRASYALDIANGGVAFVVGNVLGHGAARTNPVLMSYGSEGDGGRDGAAGREHALFMVNNTLLNEALLPGIFLRVHADKLAAPVQTLYVNNLSVGLGAGELGLANITQGNFSAPAAVLLDMAAGLYALKPDSLLRHRGTAPGTARGVLLAPQAQFMPPVGTQGVGAVTRWSPGAYQH